MSYNARQQLEDQLIERIKKDPRIMLRRIRTGLKLSQTEVSSGTELAHCTISSHENGHNIPFKTTLKIYASFFAEKMQEKGVDISEVLR